MWRELCVAHRPICGVQVTLLRARGLLRGSVVDRSDPVAKIKCGGGGSVASKVVDNSTEPVWNEKFSFGVRGENTKASQPFSCTRCVPLGCLACPLTDIVCQVHIVVENKNVVLANGFLGELEFLVSEYKLRVCARRSGFECCIRTVNSTRRFDEPKTQWLALRGRNMSAEERGEVSCSCDFACCDS